MVQTQLRLSALQLVLLLIACSVFHIQALGFNGLDTGNVSASKSGAGKRSICHHMHCHEEYLIILAVVSALILCTTLVVVVWLLAYKQSKKRRRSRKLSNPAASALVPPSWKVFTKEELKSVTKNFSEGNRLVGDSKTGGTYGGLLSDGSKVAIKRLTRSSFQRRK